MEWELGEERMGVQGKNKWYGRKEREGEEKR